MRTAERSGPALLTVVLLLLLGTRLSVGQEVDSNSETSGESGTEQPADRSNPDFFAVLRALAHVTEVPLSLDQVLDASSVIARGNFVEVIPGRSITNRSIPAIPAMRTTIFKVRPTTTLKGDARDYLYVEFPAGQAMLEELNEKLYPGELMFFLRPATSFYREEDVQSSTSAEAELELGSEEPMYSLTLHSSLLTMSDAGELTSPLHYKREFADLYDTISSLDELASLLSEKLAARVQTLE